MSELRILGKVGDMKISWNSRNDYEITAAKETFDKRIKEGWSAFREKMGTKGDKIKIFDPDAERIILVPPISGGQQDSLSCRYIDEILDEQKKNYG